MYFFFSYDERLLSALNFVLMFASSLSILALPPSYFYCLNVSKDLGAMEVV